VPSGTIKVRRSSNKSTIEVRISSEMIVVRTRCSAVECGLGRQAGRERRLTTVQPSHQRKIGGVIVSCRAEESLLHEREVGQVGQV
jgi:hypothetical protein